MKLIRSIIVLILCHLFKLIMSYTRLVLFFCSIFMLTFSFAQEGTTPCYQFVGKDSIRINLNAHKVPVTQNCASFYRLAKVNPINLSIEGYFEDYYMNDTISVQGTFKDNQLHGKAFVYYDNGNKIFEGTYDKGKKIGIWIYWYKNGNIRKKISYENDEIKIVEHYKKNGKIKIENGNGKYTDRGYHKRLVMSGELKDGVPDGEWKIVNQFLGALAYKEEYKNGKFIKGISFHNASGMKKEYFTEPYVRLDDGVIVARSKSIEDCSSCSKGRIDYKSVSFKSAKGDKSFYEYLGKTYKTDNIKGYTLCSFVVSEKGNIQNLKIENSSAVEFDESNTLTKIILNSGKWTPRIQQSIMPTSGRNTLSRKKINKPIPTVINFIIKYSDKGYVFYP